jgi:hypothetical protein
MHTTTRSVVLALAALTSLAAAGCTSAPVEVDMTPRFKSGATRLECAKSYATLRTPLLDISTHTAFTWRATVKGAGANGVLVEAVVTRAVVDLPGALGTDITIDTDGFGLVASVLGVGKMFFELVGARFSYTIAPDGSVTVSGWSEALSGAARAANEVLPGDLVPSAEALAGVIERAYGAMPRRVVKLEESWSRTYDYSLGGAAASCTESYQYKGLGEIEVEVGDDDEEFEGLEVPFNGQTRISGEGRTSFGPVSVQSGARSGKVLLTIEGDTLVTFHETERVEVVPDEDIPGAGSVATLDTGWTFTAEEWD